MNERNSISGGCQCGAIRYRISGEITELHICHCRMCQKASGNYFMPLGNVDKDQFEVSRGQVDWYFSCDPVRRGFCSKCGTPLIFETVEAPHLNVTLGSLDQPSNFLPDRQFGLEAKMSWFGDLDRLPGVATEQDDEQPEGRIQSVAASNHQHPDHETEEWPIS